MAVVADVDTDLAEAEVEHRISQVAWAEVELLPEPRRDVGNVRLAILAEVLAVASNNGSRVIEDALFFHLIDRDNECDSKVAGEGTHQLNRRTAGDSLSRVIPTARLFRAEIWSVENLLQADDLSSISRRLPD